MFIRDALGNQREIEVKLNSPATISDLFTTLRRDYGLPDEVPVGRGVFKLFDGREITNMLVLRNGRSIKSLEGMETKLEDGAEIAIFPPLVGG
jgi:molybdopterin converting factor small subunit